MRMIVCAAIRNKENGIIICGPRHGDCLNSASSIASSSGLSSNIWECGFVDQDNKFLSRKEAWKIADAAGQIRRPTGFEHDLGNQRTPNVGDDGLLFSENLY